MVGSGRKPAVKVAIGAAAVGVATSIVGVAATQPASISSSLVDLAALIVVGSSTHPTGAGVEDFFGGKFRHEMYTGPGGNDIVHVNFYEGAAGIQAALEANAGERNAVIASGWGAANASLLALQNNPALSDNTVLILDNDVARPDGGFGTRYPLFSLIGVNPYPTPSETDALRVVNTGYEYDYNSNAPGYVLNPFSALNALAGWLTTRLNQAEVDLPVDAEGRPIAADGTPLDCGANTCAITESGGVIACPDARCSSPTDRITAYVTTRNNTTYVTYTTSELPLTTLIRSFLGDYIANVTAPLLKWAVDFGYYGGNPIPSDPSAYRPSRLLPSIGDIVTALVKLPGAIIETLAAIVAPFLPRQVAPTNTQTTETFSTEQGQDTEEVTEVLSTGEGTGERTGQETQELTTEELTTEDTSTPLMNVLRNSLTALPDQSFDTPNDDENSTPIDTESVESEQNSEPEEGVDPSAIGNDDVPNADPNPDGDGDDSSESEADAAA